MCSSDLVVARRVAVTTGPERGSVEGEAIRLSVLVGILIVLAGILLAWPLGAAFSIPTAAVATGTVTFNYSSPFVINSTATKYVGLSQANGTPVNAMTLYPGPNTTASGGMHQTFTSATFNLAGKSLIFTPSGTGCSWSSRTYTRVFAIGRPIVGLQLRAVVSV